MGTFIQLVVDGLALGSIYAALALAIVLVHRATGLINFSQGAMAVLSTYIAYTATKMGVPLVLAIIIAIIFSFILGAVIERVIMRRFEGGNADTAVVVTIALLTLITGIAGWVWSYNFYPFPSLFSFGTTADTAVDSVSFLGIEFSLKTVTVLGAVISVKSIMTTLTIVLIMILLQVMFMKTKLGLSLRAVSINPQSSAFSGIPVGRMLMVGWGLAAALGAIAGVLVAPSLQLSPGMMDGALVYALAAIILGGVDSPLGVVIAAWVIGVLENLAAVYVSFIGYDLKIAVPFILILVVLILRPQGISGTKTVERV